MFVFLVLGSKFEVNRAPLNQFYEEGSSITYNSHIDMQYADGSIGVWTPTHNDILASDWYVT